MTFRNVLLCAGVVAAALLPACRKAANSAPVSAIDLGKPSGRIVRGIYPGSEPWRWTAPDFAFRLDPPGGGATVVELDVTIPTELIARTGPNGIIAKVNGVEVGRKSYARDGRDLFSCKVPRQALETRPALVEFSLEHATTHEGRQIGVIVVGVALKDYEQSREFKEAQLKEAHQAYQRVVRERDKRLSPEVQTQLMRVFHDLPVWESVRFLNVRILKNPMDLWMLQQIAFEVRPDVVVETGTWHGGSALYWAYTLNGLGLEQSRVVTVDLQEVYHEEGAGSHPLWKKHVTFFKGSSTDEAIVRQIAGIVKGKRTLINLDSDHSRDHVLKELRLYAPLVSPGSYLAVEDTHLDGVPTHPEQGPGPMAAVRQFLAEGGGKDFEQDFSREAMIMTSYPGGYLRRKSN